MENLKETFYESYKYFNVTETSVPYCWICLKTSSLWARALQYKECFHFLNSWNLHFFFYIPGLTVCEKTSGNDRNATGFLWTSTILSRSPPSPLHSAFSPLASVLAFSTQTQIPANKCSVTSTANARNSLSKTGAQPFWTAYRNCRGFCLVFTLDSIQLLLLMWKGDIGCLQSKEHADKYVTSSCRYFLL